MATLMMWISLSHLGVPGSRDKVPESRNSGNSHSIGTLLACYGSEQGYPANHFARQGYLPAHPGPLSATRPTIAETYISYRISLRSRSKLPRPVDPPISNAHPFLVLNTPSLSSSNIHPSSYRNILFYMQEPTQNCTFQIARHCLS